MRQAPGRRRSPSLLATVVVPLVGMMVAGCAPSEAQDDTSGVDAAISAAAVDGWIELFDGSSLDGWQGVASDEIPAGHWTIEEGTIRKIASRDVPTAADGQPLEGGDIMTARTFPNFELTFEWKVAPGANSGIKYNVSRAMSVASVPTTAALGFEYQVLDDDLHEDAANGPNRQAAGLYDMIGPGPGKALRPVGEFNEGRIVFDRGHGEHWLNGVKVVEFDVGSDRFNGLLSASKYAPLDGFADLRAGHIVLQDHGDDVWYRNVRIRVIEQ